MQGMHSVRIDKPWQVGGAADAADDYDLVRLQPELKQCCLKCRQYGEIAAPGAPVRMDFTFVTILDEVDSRFGRFTQGHGFGHGAHKCKRTGVIGSERLVCWVCN